MTDPKKNARVRAAHFDAVANDIAPESDEYFEHVERFVGLKKDAEPAKTNGADKIVPVKPHQRRAPVAPVSGSNGINGGDNVVRLSKKQAE